MNAIDPHLLLELNYLLKNLAFQELDEKNLTRKQDQKSILCPWPQVWVLRKSQNMSPISADIFEGCVGFAN